MKLSRSAEIETVTVYIVYAVPKQAWRAKNMTLWGTQMYLHKFDARETGIVLTLH